LNQTRSKLNSDYSDRLLGCQSLDHGGFIFRAEILDYMREGDELVEAPFQRLIEADQLMAFKHEGFWRPMDTLKDKQVLEDLVDKDAIPWRLDGASRAALADAERRIG
jgi:glucose-1-phosphate cytidylyltransferase